MRKFLVFFVILSLSLLETYAESKIYGTVDSKILDGGQLYVEVHRNYLRSLHNSFVEIHQHNLDHQGNFQVVFDVPEDYAYVKIRYVNSTGKSYFLFRNMNLLLVRDGAEIIVTINSEGVDLSDNVDPLIRIQVEYAETWPEAKAFGTMDKSAYEWKYKSLINCLNSLQTMHDKIDDIALDLKKGLLLNYQSFHVVGFLKSLSRRALSKEGGIIDTAAYVMLQKLLKDSKQYLTADVNTKYAYNYIDFLKHHIVNDLKANSLMWDERERGKQLWHILNVDYSGYVQDQLLVSFYFDYVKHPRRYFDEELRSTKDVIDDKRFRLMISFFDSQMHGAQAYPFAFQDVAGNLKKLEDFRGKVLVLEFWFNGCQPCAILSGHIKQFLGTYPHNEKVTLITINVDKNKGHWLSGVTSGKYTSDTSIDLHVGEQGYFHEMLRQYNYVGFPQLMVIGKDGKLITAFAEKPTSKEGKLAFQKLLDENI